MPLCHALTYVPLGPGRETHTGRDGPADCTRRSFQKWCAHACISPVLLLFDTYIHTHSHTCTVTHSHMHTHTVTHSHMHTHTVTHSHMHTHTVTHSHMHTHTVTLALCTQVIQLPHISSKNVSHGDGRQNPNHRSFLPQHTLSHRTCSSHLPARHQPVPVGDRVPQWGCERRSRYVLPPIHWDGE